MFSQSRKSTKLMQFMVRYLQIQRLHAKTFQQFPESLRTLKFAVFLILIWFLSLLQFTGYIYLNLSFISNMRVLSTPPGPIQALNPKTWTITKVENYRGQQHHFYFLHRGRPPGWLQMLFASAILLPVSNSTKGSSFPGWCYTLSFLSLVDPPLICF